MERKEDRNWKVGERRELRIKYEKDREHLDRAGERKEKEESVRNEKNKGRMEKESKKVRLTRRKAEIKGKIK